MYQVKYVFNHYNVYAPRDGSCFRRIPKAKPGLSWRLWMRENFDKAQDGG